jgi:glyoxylase-like metal-dependent hydrolase (beta-lactamase superfamily II)
LKQAGLATRHIHTVIVTHSHPDHFGGAGRIAKETGAKIIAHRAFNFGDPRAATRPEVSVEDLEAQHHAEAEHDDGQSVAFDDAAEAAMAVSQARGLTPWGGKRPAPGFVVKMKWMAMRLFSNTIVPKISDPVEHGDVLNLADREFFVVHTPGHTTDHFCLHDPEGGIFLAGDHVLPTITPHISGISSSRDPLRSFFYSLDRVAEIAGVKQVLPAHGRPFADLKARTEEIKRHHDERLEKVKKISRDIGPATVEAFTKRLFRPRSWGAMADSETYAHLEHLRIMGQASRHTTKDGIFIYEAG